MTAHIHGLLPDDLVAHLAAQGVDCTPAEARRVLGRVISEGVPPTTDVGAHLAVMKKPVRRTVREAIAATTTAAPPVIVERAIDDSDGFVKFLLRHDDGALTEAVRIPLEKPGAYTVCLSSQVGCAMKCGFCATGRLGLTRNLAAHEIVGAFVAVRDDLRAEQPTARVTGAVFMGQGEPLHNYDAVVQAARVLSHPCGGRVSGDAITISTVGLVPQIRRYTAEGWPFRLVVSLTSAIEEKRRRLLPVAGAYPLADVADAIRAHQTARGGRATVAWVAMSGVNVDDEEVRALQALLGDVPLRLNLIDVNDARADGYRPPTADELSTFRDALQVLQAPIVRRYSGGRERHAACGMLAATRCSG